MKIVKRILILEDNVLRTKVFKLKYGGRYHLHIFDTALEAIESLEIFKYDLIFLDHDLGGKMFVETDDENGTGLDVAKALAKMKKHKRVPVIIHSLNPVGASKMKVTLGKRAKRIPFSLELFDKVVIN